MLGGLITIAGGIIAASGFIVKRRPDAQQMIDKLAPYQGWIGIVMFGWGVFETLHVLTGISLLAHAPLRWIFWALVALADLLVGFLLGFGLLTKYLLGRNAEAERRGQILRARLVNVQVPLGFLAIATGLLYTVWLFI